MSCQIVVASCSLAQWVLDWEGNSTRIKRSIREAKAQGATLRVGPDLKVCGYGCHDHFYEEEMHTDCWQVVLDVLTDENCDDIPIDIGMPVKHKNARYICRVIAYSDKIILIRPKTSLRTDSNYEETRWFTAWDPAVQAEAFCLPECIADIQSNSEVPIGDVLISTPGICIGTLTSDELLWTKHSPPIALSSRSVDILAVSATNHLSLGNFSSLVTSLQNTSKGIGGVILYSNQHGCDGDQTYYNGGPMVLVNGEVVS